MTGYAGLMARDPIPLLHLVTELAFIHLKIFVPFLLSVEVPLLVDLFVRGILNTLIRIIGQRRNWEAS